MALQRVEFKNPVGVNKALTAADLGMNTWSDARNVQFRDGKSSKSKGYERIFAQAPADVLSLTPYFNLGIPYWLLGTSTKIYRTEGGPAIDVSRLEGAYSASENDPWIGCTLNQVVIMNNGIDVPQALLPNSSRFQNLTNWPSNTRAKVIRSFKNYLVALNISKDGNDQPTTVKWSSPADPGQVPYTWNEADVTNDAGENFLADTTGAIVDGKKLRDSFIIYKEDSVYTMRYIGGTYVFQFQQLFDDIGMLSKNCVAEFDGKHFVVGQGDIYVHNGIQKNSVISGKMKEYFFGNMKTTALQRTFVIPDYDNSEMWVCYSSSDNNVDTYCDKALLWNWRDDTWTLRDLPSVYCGTFGVVNPQEPDYWEADLGQWTEDTTSWGSAQYSPVNLKLIFSSVLNDKIYLIGSSSLYDNQVFTSRLEKTDIYLGQDSTMKVVNSVSPHVSGTGVVNVYVGAANVQGGAILWKGPYQQRIGSQFHVNCRVIGRYVAVKFEVESTGDWALSGFSLEFASISGEK